MGPAEGRICQASLDPHADRLASVSLQIIVLETYGHLNCEKYLWLPGLGIEADRSKSAPAVGASTSWEKIKLVSPDREKSGFTAQNNTVTVHISQAKWICVCVCRCLCVCEMCSIVWGIAQCDFTLRTKKEMNTLTFYYEGQMLPINDMIISPRKKECHDVLAIKTALFIARQT